MVLKTSIEMGNRIAIRRSAGHRDPLAAAGFGMGCFVETILTQRFIILIITRFVTYREPVSKGHAARADMVLLIMVVSPHLIAAGVDKCFLFWMFRHCGQPLRSSPRRCCTLRPPMLARLVGNPYDEETNASGTPSFGSALFVVNEQDDLTIVSERLFHLLGPFERSRLEFADHEILKVLQHLLLDVDIEVVR